MTGHKRHPIFPVISMRLQDDQFCAECFAEERSHSYEGVSSIGHRFTKCIFSFFSLGEKSSQSREKLAKEKSLCGSLTSSVPQGRDTFS
jgi:hypothetical protein